MRVRLQRKVNNLVTVGITPNYPETGYGYIKYDQRCKEWGELSGTAICGKAGFGNC